MTPGSVRSLKAEISAEVIEQAGDTAELHAFFASTEAPMPAGIALGVGVKDGEHVLEIRAESEEAAAPYVEKAHGEANVRLIKVAKRTTPGYLQGARRPLEPGLQIGMADKTFVGTLGGFVRDEAGVLYALSNSHAIADEGRAAAGWKIGQPRDIAATMVGTLARFVPLSPSAPNLVDAALMRVDRTVQVLRRWNGAVGVDIAGARRARAEDIGREVVKVGRTTGARKGKITAVEIDGLPVAYDQGVMRFNDQIEVGGGPETNFSAPGDSGSWILTTDGWALALLFAGGTDSSGEDYTYGNQLETALSSLGVSLA